ncbi:hypothetical protein FKM82_007812 [Ascaphus truei]
MDLPHKSSEHMSDLMAREGGLSHRALKELNGQKTTMSGSNLPLWHTLGCVPTDVMTRCLRYRVMPQLTDGTAERLEIIKALAQSVSFHST